ncbi:UDP-N-acetylmuramoyl-L-alanine--D-glutamate ligase [Candidatus Falkowbacteria bacterium]|jgi:UDP-N-acetylmuramoylalanine--D-glutamate ligase|nr:UDP-N-acetylmuramoyl-L-alanine--D-glutamate ligase [Candidatus Falkowbacteria bacterium]MBT7007677.1 UDP-N-acetylmuramoyl-L-alanine--D-glutamate ligase [Candidatus Falkowbacteria bacterium]
MKFPNYKNKKVLILGLGLLGRGVKDAIFFAEKGASVTVTDLKSKEELTESLEKLKPYDIKYTLGEHKKEDIIGSDLIIRNAAVPADSKFLKLAQKHKIPVEMDESLFAKYCPCPIIGITGTRGKTTTTILLGEVLKENIKDKNILVAGNLQGQATLPLIDQVKKDDIVILELSSWQLQGFEKNEISPQIAIFTNVYPDHLNSYKTIKEYVADKKNIYKFQKKSDHCILNKENGYTNKLEKEVPSQITWFRKKDVPKKLKTKLLGNHNLENIAATLAVTKILDIPIEQVIKSIEKFKGVPHRQEFVKNINGIDFINDTTSTTPIAGKKALDSITTPIILIAGGATKNLNLNPFAKAITKECKAVILLEGTATDELERKIRKNGGKELIIDRFDDFQAAIEKAYSLALPNDTVLLSPGAASFGIFANEFDRGDQFKRIVNQL